MARWRWLPSAYCTNVGTLHDGGTRIGMQRCGVQLKVTHPGPGVGFSLVLGRTLLEGGAPQLIARWLFLLLVTCSPSDDDFTGPTWWPT